MRTRLILFLVSVLFSSMIFGGIISQNTGINPYEMIVGLFLSFSLLGFISMPAGSLFSVPAFCYKISADIAVNCANPPIAGVNDRFWLINLEDIAAITYNNSNPLIIEGIALNSGCFAWTYQGQRNSNKPKSMLKPTKFGKCYIHSAEVHVFDNSPTTKKQLELLDGGKVVAIFQNNAKGTGGNAALEIYGLESGLIVSKDERDPTSNDTQGAYDITLTSMEDSPEQHVPFTLFLTDFPTSLAIVTALTS